jgi:hypothetical protein
MNDFISRADRMAAAIEKAMPLIVDMWASFPYAEQPKDDDVMTELRRAAQSWREFQSDMMTVKEGAE